MPSRPSQFPVVLASASPRRADILSMLGLRFTIDPADVPETRHEGEDPPDYVERLARLKAEVVGSRTRDGLVVGGDTVVMLGDRMLEKPRDRDQAVEMLQALSGRTHQVYSGLALARGGRVVSRVASADVVFRESTRDRMVSYVESGEPMDKAGAYGIQGLGAALIDQVCGDYYAVVGLSVASLVTLLPSVGLEYRFGRLATV